MANYWCEKCEAGYVRTFDQEKLRTPSRLVCEKCGYVREFNETRDYYFEREPSGDGQGRGTARHKEPSVAKKAVSKKVVLVVKRAKKKPKSN